MRHVHFFLPYYGQHRELYWKCDCGVLEEQHGAREMSRMGSWSEEAKLDDELRELRKALDAAEHDVVMDMGTEAWDSGGWYDTSISVIQFAPVSDRAKEEMRRMLGIQAQQ